MLNGVTITDANSAPIYVKEVQKTVLTIQEGTENVVTDGSEYVYDVEEDEEPNAAIFSKDNLTINGTGALSVQANFNNGITSKDELKIIEGNIDIVSADDGLMGRYLLTPTDKIQWIDESGTTTAESTGGMERGEMPEGGFNTNDTSETEENTAS